MSINTMFYGNHRSQDYWHAQERNREIVREQCCSITVTAAELSKACDEHGVCEHAAKAVVERLIERARDEAVMRILGLANPSSSLDGEDR